MAIDIEREHLVPLRDYARLRPPGRGGKRMHIATAYRHATQGVRGERLETVVWGGCRYTSLEAIARFLTKLSSLRMKGPEEQAQVPQSRNGEEARRIYD